jgi:hypothetical protein
MVDYRPTVPPPESAHFCTRVWYNIAMGKSNTTNDTKTNIVLTVQNSKIAPKKDKEKNNG